jgi:hypothetical protein
MRIIYGTSLLMFEAFLRNVLDAPTERGEFISEGKSST